MELKDEIIGKLAEPLIEEVKKAISEEERKRKSLPKIQLNTLEIEFLIGVANGRSTKELNTAIQLCTHGEQTYNTIYNKLLRKLEADTLAHTLYKAMKLGYIK